MVIISFRNCNLSDTNNVTATSWGSSPSEIARWKNNLNHTNHEFYVMFDNLLFQKKMLGSVLAALVGKTT